MSPGLFDLPAPLFDGVETLLSSIHVPALLRLALYAVASAVASMAVYRFCSRQDALQALRADIAESQRALARFDGDFSALSPLIARNLRLTLRQLGLTLGPALIASVPLLFVLVWLSNQFSYDATANGEPIAVCIEPLSAAKDLRWPAQSVEDIATPQTGCRAIDWNSQTTQTIADASGRMVVGLAPRPHSEILHKFGWFNYLIGNPDGYVVADAAVSRIHLALPPRAILGIGPGWLRGWEATYFIVLIIASLGLKWYWRIR